MTSPLPPQPTPPPSRTRVALFAALGYAYVVGVLAALGGALVAVTRGPDFPGRGFVVAVLAGWGLLILGALLVRLRTPGGTAIERGEAPRLFAAVDQTRAAVGAPAPDVVLMIGDLNAYAATTSRFAVFGTRRELGIGILLLEALGPAEVQAILAHELAHFSREHNSLYNWLTRLSTTWHVLALSLRNGYSLRGWPFLPFFRWYTPRFEALVLALSRAQEHESDTLSARATSPEVAARALARLHLGHRFVTVSLWPGVFAASAERADPPSGALARVALALRTGPEPATGRAWVRAALRERTIDAHTHPSLADRLAALGAEPPAPDGDGRALDEYVARLTVRSGPSAAEAWLSHKRWELLLGKLDAEWGAAMLPIWRQLHADARVWQAAGLDRAAPAEGDVARTLPLEALWARARWATFCEPPEAALPHVRQVLARAPRHREATVALGRLLLEHDDADVAEGERLLEAAAARDDDLAMAACQALQAHYLFVGRGADAERCGARARRIREERFRNIDERQSLAPRDRIEPYSLPPAMLDTLRRRISVHREVARAYLVRKMTKHLRDQPLVVLVLEIEVPWYRSDENAEVRRTMLTLLEHLTLPEEADKLVARAPRRSRLLRKLRQLAGAECYRRESAPAAASRRSSP